MNKTRVKNEGFRIENCQRKRGSGRDVGGLYPSYSRMTMVMTLTLGRVAILIKMSSPMISIQMLRGEDIIVDLYIGSE